MKHENSARLNLKRSTSEESEAVKKVKLEELEVLKTEDLEDELPQIRNKPLNRGVERISPYPTECRPTQPYYDWHRRQLIKDVTERLAIQGRRIVGLPRFLDDGIVFDWVYDKSILSGQADVPIASALDQAERSTLTQAPAFEIPRAKQTTEVFEALKTDLTVSTNEPELSTQLQVAEGSLDNPIVILEEEQDQRDEDVDLDVVSSSGSESPDPDSDANDSASEMPIDSHPANVEANGSNDSSWFLNADFRLNSQTGSFPREWGHPDVPTSVADQEADVDEGIVSTRSIRGREISLRRINWRNYQSILIFKRLPKTTTVEDVYAFLLRYGVTFQSVKEISIHCPKKGGTLASIEFYSSANAQEALSKLCNAVWQPSSSRSSNTLKIEPCHPPKWYANSEQMTINRAYTKGSQYCADPSVNHEFRKPTGIGSTEEQPKVIGIFGAFRQPSGVREGGRHIVSGLPSYNSDTLPSSTPAHSSTPKGEFIPAGGYKTHSETLETEDTDADAYHDQLGDEGQKSRSSRSSTSGSSKDSSDSDSSDTDHSNSTSAYGSTDEASDSAGQQGSPRETNDKVKRFQSVVVERRTKLKQIVLPKVIYGRPRRILLPRSSVTPIATVSMRGDFQFIDSQDRLRLRNMSLPATVDSKRRVEDACIIGDVGVVGFTGEINQVSLLSFNKAGNKAAVDRLPPLAHSKQGINCLASIPPVDTSGQSLEFLSGGFDKQIRRWRVVRELDPDDGASTFSATVQRFPIEHNSTVTSVAWHGNDTTILSAAGTKLWTTHVERQSVVGDPSVLSNPINHIHAHSSNPHIVILEVAHPFSQVQVFDVRQGYARKPIMTFGYSDTSASAKGIRARRRKGDTSIKYFVRGFDDGVVALWDYRNVKTTLKMHRMEEPVYHTVFTKVAPVVWAFGGNQVDYIDPTDTRS